ncbi:unnamed protein product, partial [Brassica oleracea]
DNRLQCCIAGKIAEIMTQGNKQPNNGDICLIRYAKLGNYKGIISRRRKHLKICKFHVDGNSLDMYQAKHDKVLIQEKRQKWSQFPFKTIQEMKRTDKDGKLRVVCTVYAIDTVHGWYYIACAVCSNKVFKQAIIFDEVDVQGWWCEFCQSNVTKVSPMYKLDLLVQDQTGGTKITLLSSVAKSIVKTSAAKVVNVLLDEVEDPELLPECITDLVGKTYKFDVTIEKGAEIFKVLKVWSVYNTLMVDSQSETALERETIAISGSEVSLLTYSDESSSKMTTPSKRTVDDIVDIPYNTSTSKICHVKSIKVEKMTSEELSLKKN